MMVVVMGCAPAVSASTCHHESLRLDGFLDNHCLKCGADGYWRDARRCDKVHPSGKILLRPA